MNIGNLKTIISNKKIKQTVSGNTGAVYISPLNSLRFVLNKLKKDKVDLNKDFYVFTGSTGRSTGPHLDFRINWFQTRLDPMSVLK